MIHSESFVIICPGCASRLKAHVQFAGKRARCPKCGQSVEVPLPNDTHKSHQITQKPRRRTYLIYAVGIAVLLGAFVIAAGLTGMLAVDRKQSDRDAGAGPGTNGPAKAATKNTDEPSQGRNSSEKKMLTGASRRLGPAAVLSLSAEVTAEEGVLLIGKNMKAPLTVWIESAEEDTILQTRVSLSRQDIDVLRPYLIKAPKCVITGSPIVFFSVEFPPELPSHPFSQVLALAVREVPGPRRIDMCVRPEDGHWLILRRPESAGKWAVRGW